MRAHDAAAAVEVARAVERQHRAQLLARERMLGADAVFLDHQDARRARDAASARVGGERRRARRSSRPTGRSTAGDSLPSGHISALQRRLLRGVEQHGAASPASAASSGVADRVDDTRLFSDEQLVALSKVFERTILSAASVDVGGLVDDRRRRCRRRRRRPACRSRRRRARWPASRWPRRGRTGASARAVDCLGDRRRQQLHQVARRADAVELRVDELDQPRARSPSPWARARRSPRCGP